MFFRLIACSALMAAGFATFAPAGAAGQATDPFDSPVWRDILEMEFDGAEVVYDQSIYLVVPDQVEEAFSVPVVMNFAHTPYTVAEIALFAENNPFPIVARIYPQRGFKAVGFDIRLERSTPVRAAIMDGDGVWHVVQKQVLVMTPGGCSAPDGAAGGAAMGKIAMRQFVRTNGGSRLKVRIGHPMHTGLVVDDAGDAIPAQYIERLSVRDEFGGLASMVLWASVAANPVFMFDLPETQQSVRVTAEDTDGTAFILDGKPSAM
jgi:sulfur-oxidizing protein SoxY